MRWPALVLVGIFAFGVAIPALAAYLGPDRGYSVTVTESETVRDTDKDEWLLTGPSGQVCYIRHSCNEHPGTDRQRDICGWEAVNSHCTPGFSIIETTRTETHYHPEATVSGTVQCAQNGTNGWCIGSGSIALGANEPLGGYSILGIEGNLDGNTFFCPGTSCSVAGNPGSANANYWALSSYGDSSRMGSSTLKIDNDLPVIVGLVSGGQGNGGWYVGDITLTAVGADATSGLAAQEVQVNGGGWQNTSATISSDGAYSVVFRAIDEAGQESYTAAQALGRDTAPPTLSLDAYDAPARGAAMVAGAASDATSGVVAVHFSLNGSLNQSVATSGGAWQLHWDSTEVPNGHYTIQVYAEDQAGHYSAPAQVSVQVDNAVPYINLSSGCWPIWQALDLNAGPGTAPISLVSLTVSNGSQSLTEIFPAPPQGWTWNRTFSDGSIAPVGDYSLQVYVEDASGNSSSRGACIRIPDPDAAGFSTQDGAQAGTLQSFVPSGEPGSPPPAASFADVQPSVTVITELQPQPAFVQQLQQATPANAAVWGPAALTLAAAATAIAMAEKEKREEEERRRNEPDPFKIHPDNLMAAHLSDEDVLAQVKAAGARPNISVEEARIITHNALLASGSYTVTGAQLNEQARQAAKDTQVGGGGYTVQAGDNWFSIAEKIYGNQRMAGQLIDANVPKGSDNLMLQPGQVIALPTVTGTEATHPNFDPDIWDKVVKFTLTQEALRKAAEEDEEPRLAKGGPQSPALHPNFPDGPAGLELALRMLADGTLTPEGFLAAFPHVDLANAIYAANTGQLTAATIEWLWRENVYSQVALQQKQEDMAALRKGLIDLQARDITDAELLAMFPHLPIDQALAMLNNPEGLYNLWMTHVGKAWLQDIEDRKNRERGWEATAQRYQGLADALGRGEAFIDHPPFPEPPFSWPDLVRVGQGIYAAGQMSQIQFTTLPQNPNFPNRTYFSVSAPGLSLGRRIDFRQAMGISGTRYSLPNRVQVTQSGLLHSVKTGLWLDTLIAVGTNYVDFTTGEHSEYGWKSYEFALSTTVDFLASIAVGVGAALLAGLILGASAPLWASGLLALGLGFAIAGITAPIVDAVKDAGFELLKKDD
ncbi:MAG: LysM peptidoglycan-binding domain-containing protein [Anaerolineales bacterium]|nr:LysM peptidoglycan-binding domain-containing protein [Anaerolineales bacterium]